MNPAHILAIFLITIAVSDADGPRLIPASPATTGIAEGDAGVDVNALDDENLTPLFYAASVGDALMVRQLLGKGANPKQPGQSISPLCAAAQASSAEVVKLLLDAGAEVPLTIAKDSGKLNKPVHPAYLHPVIAAIRVGALPVLELLMSRAPGLDIQSLVPMDQKPKPGGPAPPSPNFIADSMMKGQWELAAFLIDHGCGILEGSKGGLVSLLDYMLMARASAAGDEALPAVEALLRRGISPVRDVRKNHFPALQARSFHREGFATLEPWDGLSAAILSGNIKLARRFLAVAHDTTPRYQDELMMLAMYAENSEVIDMIRERFPEVRPCRWKPDESDQPSSKLRDEDLRLFLPRTNPPPRTPDSGMGEHVLAVIASPEASGPGAALSAIASNTKKWKVVDRELIESALGESTFSKPWLNGEHRLSDLGDRLAADALVIVSEAKGQTLSLYSFEVVEVATGLVAHREHITGKTFAPDKDLPALLERAARTLDAASRNERHQAVNLLSFSARGGLPNQLALAKLLHAAVQHEVDATPGMISLTRAQTNRLVEEQALQGKDSVWGAAHLIEGSISPADDGKIKVALRLETLRGADSIKTDAEAIGDINVPTELVAEAWQKLFGNARAALRTPANPATAEKDAQQQARQESQRLLREVEWLYAIGVAPERILPLIESASALGAPASEVIPLHLDCLYRQIKAVSRKRFDSSSPAHAISMPNIRQYLDDLPIALDVADRLAYELPKARELLQQASFYFERHGESELRTPVTTAFKGNEFWHVINALSYIRAAIYEKCLPKQCIQEYRTFGDELDGFTRSYFQALDTVGDMDSHRASLMTGPTHILLKRNPELAKGLEKAAAHAKSARPALPETTPKTGELQNSAPQQKRSSDSLPGSLLADFRKGAGPLPGYACWPLIDNADPNRLWMFYFSGSNHVIPAVDKYQLFGKRFDKCWLLAIDCLDGSIIHCIDLKAAAGAGLGRNLSGFPCPFPDMAFDQNRTRIMTSISWLQLDEPDNGIHKACLVIEKESGKTTTLPAGILFESSRDGFAALSCPVVGMGDNFYFIHYPGNRKLGTNTRYRNGRERAVFQLDAGLQLRALTESGRRPELTPFDAVDRAPNKLAPHDGKLLFFNRDHAAHLNLGDHSWQTLEYPNNEFWPVIKPIIMTEERQDLEPILQIRIDGKDTGWRFDRKKLMPGHLQCIGKNGDTRQVALHLEIPEDFRQNTRMMRPGGTDENTVSFDDFTKNEIPHMVVLSQTRDNLIIALQYGSMYWWKRPSRDAYHLPFLWKVPKKEFFEMLESGSGG